MDATPIPIDEVSNVLKDAGLSKLGLGLKTLEFAVMAFGREWGIRSTTIGGIKYIERTNSDDCFNDLLRLVVERARMTDFLSVEVFEDSFSLDSEERISQIHKIVDLHPGLEWLDEDDGVFWSKSRARGGSCKTLNVCRKVFSFAREISLKSLLTALQRAVTVDQDHIPPAGVLEQMLVRSGEFTVDGRLVIRLPAD